MKPFKGEVLSIKMAQTAIVGVIKTKIHPLYKKRIRRIKKYHVHDLLGVKVGDKVEFIATKPISKTKKWVITQTVGKAAKRPMAAKKVEKAVKVEKSKKRKKK
ncbi:MAG: 30S ribosomal protein S17 [bacterium]|nr:30S ribosomal protein S17 [bacterium]